MHTELVVRDRAILGEGPIWHAAEEALYWLDIKGRRVKRYHPGGDRYDDWRLPFRVMSLAPRWQGGFIAGSDHGLVALDGGFATHRVLCDPEAGQPTNRFNDGKVDRSGRFWAGTMDDAEEAASGALYRFDEDCSCRQIDDGYLVTNGPAFSVDGSIMYHSDSAAQVIYRFDLAPDGMTSGKRVFARFGQGEGYPDGMTVDAEDHLWIAFWDGWCLRRLSPAGAVVATVPLPVARPTSVAFRGRDLDQLFVTSATIGQDEAALARQSAAGGLLRLWPGVQGVAALPFLG